MPCDTLREQLRYIAKLYGFKVNFKKMKECGGYANLNGTFVIDPYCSRRKLIGRFFHEMAHEINAIHKYFPVYHSAYKDKTTKAKLRAYKRTAWRAEVFTDDRAEELQKFWFPRIKYLRSYVTKKDQEWLRKYMSNW